MTNPVDPSPPNELGEHAGGADPGPGAPDQLHADPAKPDEQFQSPMGVAGISSGGTSPADENPAADPGGAQRGNQ